jgi:hypothetical protein
MMTALIGLGSAIHPQAKRLNGQQAAATHWALW